MLLMKKQSLIRHFNNIEQLAAAIQLKKHSSVFVLADENTHRFCLPMLTNEINDFHVIKIKSGDANKNITTCQIIWQTLNDNHADRNSLLINLGGGMVCDAGGFAASVYKRGIDFIHIPTTLMAMCDAAIGGKNAINFEDFKNNIGCFQMPKQVLICTEIIKHAMLTNDKAILKQLRNNQLSDLDFKSLIKKSVQFKLSIIEKDFKDNSIRKQLNTGHTIGHAIESVFLNHSKNKLLHGEAVAIGLQLELLLSVIQYNFPISKANSIFEILDKWFHYQPLTDNQKTEIFKLLAADKKNNNNKINFTLFADLGKPKIDSYPKIEEIKNVLAAW